MLKRIISVVCVLSFLFAVLSCNGAIGGLVGAESSKWTVKNEFFYSTFNIYG